MCLLWTLASKTHQLQDLKLEVSHLHFVLFRSSLGEGCWANMGYEEVWRVLDNLLIELRKRGELIPTDVMNDLHSAKTMMQILKADPSHTDNVPKVETYLGNVEFSLLYPWA